MQSSDQDIHFIPFLQLSTVRYASVETSLYDYFLLIDQICFYVVDNNDFILKEYILMPDRKLNDKIVNELSSIKPFKYFLNVVGQFVEEESNTAPYTGVDYYKIIDILPIFFNKSFHTLLQIIPTDKDSSTHKTLAIYSPSDLINNHFQIVDPKNILDEHIKSEPDQQEELYEYKSSYQQEQEEEVDYDWKRENFDAMTDGQFGDYDDLEGDFDVDSHTGR